MTTIISGEVLNFSVQTEQKFIELIINDPFSQDQVSHTEYLDETGKFRFEINRLYPQEIMIRYKHLFDIYAFPGDSIHIAINSDILKEKVSFNVDLPSYFHINCNNKQFQDEFIEFRKELFDSLFNPHQEQDSIKYLNYNQYKIYIDKRSEKYSNFLENFNNENNTCDEFRNWGKAWNTSNSLDDLMRYRWYHPYKNNIDEDTFRLPNEYFDFLNNPDYFTEDLMISNVYYDFLQEYAMYIPQYLVNDDTLSKEHKFWREGRKVEAYNVRKRYFFRYSSDFLQEILMTHFYHQLLDWKLFDLYEGTYDSTLVGRSDYINILNKRYQSLMTHVDNPVYQDGTQIQDADSSDYFKVFNSLTTRYPDKVIYVDFWAPWCGPCMGEMPFSKKIQQEFKGKDVVFVFLANRCTEKSWRATISEKQLSGKHFLLTDEEYALLSNRFDFSGIPHYLIIDKNGLVVNDRAPRPREKDRLVKLIETYL